MKEQLLLGLFVFLFDPKLEAIDGTNVPTSLTNCLNKI